MSSRSWRILFAVLVGLGAVAGGYRWYGSRPPAGFASWEERNAAVKALETQMKSLADQIKQVHGQGECETYRQCRVVGLGPQTCGGFPTYLVYSIGDVDEPGLLALVNEFNQDAEKVNAMSYGVPPCGVPAKEALCENGRCHVQ